MHIPGPGTAISGTDIKSRRLHNIRLPLRWAVWGALALAWPVQAAPEQAAVVRFASGYVAATAPAATARQLAKDDAIYQGDRIDTADNARVQMRFTDGGLVSLMPNSTFSVDDYLYDDKAEDDAALVFGLLKGGLRTVTGAIGKVKHDQYELKTPVATLGIRGTEYVAVLRPANTLRVHVGRGKVVITNDQGTLEVPEGRNAVVTLGTAPEFSEQGPQYQATSPFGDRLIATEQRRQDPHLLDPRVNMPPHGPDSFDYLAGPSFMVGVVPNYGGIFNYALEDIDPGTWQSFGVTTSGALSWGEYTDGTGTLGGSPLNLYQNEYLPYIVGSTPVITLPTGMLNYSLDGATMARGAYSSDTGTLDTFNLGIDLGSLDYTLDFQLTTQNTGVYSTSGTTGNLMAGSTAQGFSFSTQVQNSSSACTSAVCQMDVQGFLAGFDGKQAGVAYTIDTDNDRISGAAGLKQP